MRKLCFLAHILIVSPGSLPDPDALTPVICSLSLDGSGHPTFTEFATVDIEIFRPLLSLIAPSRSARPLLATLARDVHLHRRIFSLFHCFPVFMGISGPKKVSSILYPF
jgi:hypothetical protein